MVSLRQKLGLILGPVASAVLILTPFSTLNQQAHSLLAILSLVIIYWITEALPIPVTALLGIALSVLFGLAPPSEIFSSFSSSVIFLFIGSFILARAMSLHKLDRRIALALLSLSKSGGSPWKTLLTLGITSTLISMWLSNTATTAMMIPIALGILSHLRLAEKSSPSPPLFMLVVAYGASIGGIATPVGSPPNLIGIGFLESMAQIKITFFEWMTAGIPVVAATFVILILLFKVFLRKKRVDKSQAAVVERSAAGGEYGNLTKWTCGERNTLIAFSTAVVLWMTPGVVALIGGSTSPAYLFLSAHLDEGASALLAASLLFILPVSWKKGEFTITWQEAVRIDWGTILLFGGGIVLGKLTISTGLADALGVTLRNLTGIQSVWTVTALAIVLGIIVSETTSNTASASMVVPLVISLAQGAHISPIPPVLGGVMGASFGFMLPVSTPPNALAYGTGLVPLKTMIKLGILFDLLGAITIWLALRLVCPLMGWE